MVEWFICYLDQVYTYYCAMVTMRGLLTSVQGERDGLRNEFSATHELMVKLSVTRVMHVRVRWRQPWSVIMLGPNWRKYVKFWLVFESGCVRLFHLCLAFWNLLFGKAMARHQPVLFCRLRVESVRVDLFVTFVWFVSKVKVFVCCHCYFVNFIFWIFV